MKLSDLKKENTKGFLPYSTNQEAIDGISSDTVMTPDVTKSAIQTISLEAVDINLSALDKNIIPDTTNTRSLGSPTHKWKEIYAEDVHMGLNTLYLGDTPILGTDQDTVVIKTDPDQSMNIQTFGVGTTNMTSVSGINITTSGLNSDVDIKSTGDGGKVKFGSISSIDFTAPISNISGNLSITGDLTVTGSATFNGSPVIVDAEVLQVADNVIVVNNGEVGSGVTAGTAGLKVDRGELADFLMVFDESVDRFRVGTVGNLETLATQNWVSANTSMSWNDLTDKPSTYTPINHSIAGSEHTTSTLSQLNAKISDANLDAAGTARPASDVSAWAKASSKPTYTYSEVGAEQAFTKNSAFNKNFGTAAGTVCQGNDSRLSDARTPTSHNHGGGDITSAVANATTATNCSRSISAGGLLTGGGALTANRTITLSYGGNWQVRRTVHSTSNPSGGADGDVWLKY